MSELVTPMGLIFFIVGIVVAIAAVAVAILAARSAMTQQATNVIQDSSDSLPSQTSPREITYISKTRSGMSSTSQSMRGTSTSTVSQLVGNRAGEGKVITSVADLATLSVGTRIRFTGRISLKNSTPVSKFTACIGDEFRGLDYNDNPVWMTLEVITPPLLLELSDGEVQVINDDYGLGITVTEHAINGVVQGQPMFWPQQDRIVWDEAKGEGTRHYCGLELEDEVVVTGMIEQSSEGLAINAENISMTR